MKILFRSNWFRYWQKFGIGNSLKYVDFSVLHNKSSETNDGFVEVDRSDIIARNEMEIIEQKFREMGLPITDENNDEKKEEDEIRFGSFEDLNEISVQEQQHSLPFRNDI